MNQVEVIKIGGNIIDDPEALTQFLDLFSKMKTPRILVHGGGKKATELSKRLGIESKMHEGRRITDGKSLEVVTMVYAGLINKNIVAALQAANINALGLSGADLNLIPATKRKSEPVDYGFVGDIHPDEINTSQLMWLLDHGITPVFCALTHDGKGNMLNTNADSIAAGIAMAVSTVRKVGLHLCFEKPGVLTDADDDDSLIEELPFNEYGRMKADGSIFQGMIPKLENAFKAQAKGVDVIIRHALVPEKGTKLRGDE